MKILLVVSLGYVAGGAEKHTLVLKRALTQRGHQVRVLSANTPGQELFSDYQFTPISKRSPLKYLHYLFYHRSFRALRHAIRDFHPDLVHFHTLTACTPSVLFATGNIPTIMTIHGPEEFTLKLLPWFMDTTDFTGDTIGLQHLTRAGQFKYAYYRLLQRPLYQLGLRRLRLVIAPSHYMIKSTAADFGAIPLRLVYNGLPTTIAQPLPHNQRVLYVGRLVKLKGVAYLIRAFAQVAARHPGATLRLVGDGPERHHLQELATQLGIADRVQFAGWVPQDRLPAEYAAADLAVVPSIGAEALGLVAIEAMAAGRPVVVSRTGGLPELVAPHHTGLTVPPSNAKQLGAAISELLRSPKQLETMGAAAAQAAQDFSETGFIDRVESIYNEIAQ